MGKLTCAVAIEYLIVNAKRLEELGQDDTANAVDGIGADTELTLLDSLDVGQTQVKHRLHMTLVHGVVHHDTSQLFNGSIVEVLGLGDSQYLSTIGSRQELTIAVEELQGIPLCGIVRGSNDNATVGLVPANGQLGGRRGGQANIDNLVAHANEGAADHVTHHRA